MRLFLLHKRRRENIIKHPANYVGPIESLTFAVIMQPSQPHTHTHMREEWRKCIFIYKFHIMHIAHVRHGYCCFETLARPSISSPSSVRYWDAHTHTLFTHTTFPTWKSENRDKSLRFEILEKNQKFCLRFVRCIGNRFDFISDTHRQNTRTHCVALQVPPASISISISVSSFVVRVTISNAFVSYVSIWLMLTSPSKRNEQKKKKWKFSLFIMQPTDWLKWLIADNINNSKNNKVLALSLCIYDISFVLFDESLEKVIR